MYMEHPVIRPFLDTLERNEILPTVPPIPDMDKLEYLKVTENRFSNPTIIDTIFRNCHDGYSPLLMIQPTNFKNFVEVFPEKYCSPQFPGGNKINS